MSQPVIFVTGAYGQLGQELKVLSAAYPSFAFIFKDRDEISIDDEAAIQQFFGEHKFAYCINCAAYTAVDKAESDQDEAYKANAEGARVLAAACKANNTRFIHISTDYVFDGQSPVPYKEDSPTGPISVYGVTKLKGEELALQEDPQTIIIRTAWVYSSFGKNFVKTMMTLMQQRDTLSVVNDQVGAPTYAADLAQCIMHIVASSQLQITNWQPGIYHYSNQGKISWYDFAVAIKEAIGSKCEVKPIPSSAYPTPAKRPSFSLLDTQKVRDTFHCAVPEWRVSLDKCIELLK